MTNRQPLLVYAVAHLAGDLNHRSIDVAQVLEGRMVGRWLSIAERTEP